MCVRFLFYLFIFNQNNIKEKISLFFKKYFNFKLRNKKDNSKECFENLASDKGQ